MLFRGTLGVDQSGSLSGFVASHARGGTYYRARSIPVNPNTADQQRARTDLAANSQAWNGLSEAQREAWTAYGITGTFYNRIGQAISLSGIAAFNQVNSMMVFSGQSTITAPPTVDSSLVLPYPTTASVVQDDGDIVITIAAGADSGAGKRLVVACTRPLSAGRYSPKGGYRLAGSAALAAIGAQAAFTYPFSPDIDSAVFLRYYSTASDGKVSAPIVERVIVSAAP